MRFFRREPDDLRTLGRSTNGDHEVVLRERRLDGGQVVHELIVNGAFAMDSREVASEIALADTAADARTALVGGLGLGFTASRLLEHGVRRLDVVELEPALVRWAREGKTPLLGCVAGDPRTHLHVGDVAPVLRGEAGPPGPWDAILLDVDNGPDFLIHATNADLYEAPLLEAALARLTPGGTLAVWCQGRSPALAATLEALSPGVREVAVPVEREGHQIEYAIHLAKRPEQHRRPATWSFRTHCRTEPDDSCQDARLV
ncbi:hypothetical protein GCM10027418_17350 [Mariniluteicoccus endophyticus]